MGTFRFTGDTDAIVRISNTDTSGYVIADAVQFLAEGDSAGDALDAKSTQTSAPSSSVQAAEHVVKQLEQELARRKADAPPPLPEAMAPADRSSNEIADSPLHIRGEVKNVGDVVPRGFLRVCSSGDASIRNPRGSGRIDLADWLTDPDNPLVARVFVNRVWMHLMGEGIVRTVDNFGRQGQRPTHPELLDILATDFVRGGWHLKPLVRKIVASRAYGRSSDYDSESIALDPENRLLWRMHRRRLPAESIRDAMILAAGRLDRRARIEPMQGRGTLVSTNNADSKADFDDVSQPCRSIYLPVVRGYMPALLTSLDVADPDLLVGRRPTTNVPSQALVLINSPDVNTWARRAAERIVNQASDYQSRLDLVYAHCLQRGPNSRDRQIAERFFDGRRQSLDAWHQWIAAIFAGTEFRLLD